VLFKQRLEDFVVREEIEAPFQDSGPYALYRVTKKGITTFQAHIRLASTLGLSPSEVVFPGLKDRKAIAIQYASVRGKGPEEISGNGFSAQLVGSLSRHLRPSDIKGNHFTITLRNLPRGKEASIAQAIGQVKRYGLPNYFDRQRFGSYIPGEGFIGKKILERDAEGALRIYICCPFPVDRAAYRAFKEKAAKDWGNWEKLLQDAPSPSNLRSLLTFLKDHPYDFRKALNLIPPRLLSLFLSAYQSWLWNKLAGRYLKGIFARQKLAFIELSIADEKLPFYLSLPDDLLDALREKKVPFFHHRAVFDDPIMAQIAGQILTEEGLELRDFKARILKRAYLSKGERPLLLFPREFRWRLEKDETKPKEQKLVLEFFLPPGSYATLVVKAIALRVQQPDSLG